MTPQHYLIPDWPAPHCVKACTTLRFAGNSNAPFNSFNFSDKDGDDITAVMANRQQLMQELNLENQPVWSDQVHGIEAIQADKVKNIIPQADAFYTQVPNVVCAVLTADCLPLLLCNEAGTQVAAIHAGWRGLLNGVIEATVSKLITPGKHWLAWLGPAIGPNVFEVGHEVYEQFVTVDSQSALAFVPTVNGKWLGDLYKLARQRLAKCGIINIYGGDFCTYSDPQRFYSYRRDQGKTGRMASIIWLTNSNSRCSRDLLPV